MEEESLDGAPPCYRPLRDIDAANGSRTDADGSFCCHNPTEGHARRSGQRGCFVFQRWLFGGLSAEEFVDWLDEVERIFEYAEVPEDEQVPAVAMRLKGRASVCWKNLGQSRKHISERLLLKSSSSDHCAQIAILTGQDPIILCQQGRQQGTVIQDRQVLHTCPKELKTCPIHQQEVHVLSVDLQNIFKRIAQGAVAEKVKGWWVIVRSSPNCKVIRYMMIMMTLKRLN
ncbi:uncharacterized protein LOC112272388 [Brachypodium distachyon]|uniref:uncharacterized protein LOC112272388 n=1 Tax=Brachypodium distachyon TaxID=15368 RepID=UPI000D0DB3D9|nr:uncharacterized protein LOC112272388 [Brachypodium distachyon]|eukprot:XP_024318804.1 uncharacterized protein LOC112272388 [Brachypodium distachyon]